MTTFLIVLAALLSATGITDLLSLAKLSAGLRGAILLIIAVVLLVIAGAAGPISIQVP